MRRLLSVLAPVLPIMLRCSALLDDAEELRVNIG